MFLLFATFYFTFHFIDSCGNSGNSGNSGNPRNPGNSGNYTDSGNNSDNTISLLVAIVIALILVIVVEGLVIVLFCMVKWRWFENISPRNNRNQIPLDDF